MIRKSNRPVSHSTIRFPFAEMKKKLDTKPAPWALDHYYAASGGYISGTLGAHAEKVAAGQQSPARRDTCSYIYHVHAGAGKSEIVKCTGKSKTVRWEVHDTFCVPAWSRIVHTADGEQDSYLFVLSDPAFAGELEDVC
jgi:gentisate 1,2-dioxygenase